MLRTIPAVKMAMTPFPQTIQLEAPVAEAWRMMTELGVRHLPVADGSRLVGVVSGRDLGLAMDSRLGTPEARGVLVSDVCERHAALLGDVGELAVARVAPQPVRPGLVDEVEIRASVAIDIR